MIEITPDNRQDYFELAVFQPPMRKMDGDPATRFVYALKMKDEFAEGYRDHAAYSLPDDFQERYPVEDHTMMYMMAGMHDGGFELNDVCRVQATFNAVYDASAAEVLVRPASPETAAHKPISTPKSMRQAMWISSITPARRANRPRHTPM